MHQMKEEFRQIFEYQKIG